MGILEKNIILSSADASPNMIFFKDPIYFCITPLSVYITNIVTPRKPMSTSTSPRSTFGFIVMTISHVTPLCSIYILVKACNGNTFRFIIGLAFFCSDEDILEYYLFFAVMRISLSMTCFLQWWGYPSADVARGRPGHHRDHQATHHRGH